MKEGLVQGAVFGGVVGGLVGLMVPPHGLVIAAGPILGTLASAISGAASMAVAGATIGGDCSVCWDARKLFHPGFAT